MFVKIINDHRLFSVIFAGMLANELLHLRLVSRQLNRRIKEHLETIE